MSNATSEEMFARGHAFLDAHRRQYLSSGGREGHILDQSGSGGLSFATHLLLRHVGRKSGKRFINPLFYGLIGGEPVVIASKGGADHHPDWYLNLTARKEVEFQIATQAFRGTWRQAAGEERAALWKFINACNPSFGRYQATTSREIPVVLLKATEEIPVFTEADAD